MYILFFSEIQIWKLQNIASTVTKKLCEPIGILLDCIQQTNERVNIKQKYLLNKKWDMINKGVQK